MSLARNFATVGAGTAASRLLGFLRDAGLAASLGSGAIADAFVIAFRLPNLFRRLFAEGAFNSAFVPLVAAHREREGDAGMRRFVGDAFGLMGVALAVTTVVAIIGAPFLVRGLAPGFVLDAHKFDLAVLLTRIALPYLVGVGLVAVLSAFLNANKYFTAAAWVPVTLNVLLIGVIGWIHWAGWDGTETAGIALAVGVAVSGFVQLGLIAWALRSHALGFPFPRQIWNRDMAELVRLGVPGMIAGGIAQLSAIIGTIIASMQPGAVSWLYYADRVYQLPLGVFGIAIGVVLLPEITERVQSGDEAAVARTQSRALEFASLLTLPAAAALMVAATPIVTVLFERGAFTAADSRQTGHVLAALAAGLPAYVLIKVLSTAYFARRDTTRPMVYALIGIVANVAAAFALFPSHGATGVAMAISLSAWLNVALLWTHLARKGQFTVDAVARRRLPRILAATAGMAVVVHLLAMPLSAYMQASVPATLRFGALGLLVAAGLVSYALLALWLGGADRKELERLVRR